MVHSPQPWEARAGRRSHVFLLPWGSQTPPRTQEPRHSGQLAPYRFENCFSQTRKASHQQAHAVTPGCHHTGQKHAHTGNTRAHTRNTHTHTCTHKATHACTHNTCIHTCNTCAHTCNTCTHTTHMRAHAHRQHTCIHMHTQSNTLRAVHLFKSKLCSADV